MTHSTVTIQIAPESVPSTPSWLGEVAAFAQVLASTGILRSIQERVRFARARFGLYDTVDFVVVLIGMPSAVSPPSKPFMSDSSPLRAPLWRSLVAITCPLARRSRAFLPPLIK